MNLQALLTFIHFHLGVLSAFAPHTRLQSSSLQKSSSHDASSSSSSSSSISQARSLISLSAKRSGAMSRRKKSKGGGFAKVDVDVDVDVDADQPAKEEDNVQVSKPGSIYSRPALYDLAFGYRNYEEEVKFLLNVHEKYSTGENSNSNNNDDDDGISILELAAGPARHTITALRNNGDRVHSCTAVDLSEDMINYSNEIADEELGDAGYGDAMRDRFHYILDDMRTAGKGTAASGSDSGEGQGKGQLQPSSFDSAWILLGSMQHLTTNDDVISCFSSTSNLLREGGTLTIELPHPRETFTMVECTRNGWEVPLEDENGEEYGELKIIWGDDDDAFDPIRQVRDFTVAMELIMSEEMKKAQDPEDVQSVREIVPMRLFTYQEIEAMARIAGFEIAKMYGALSDEVDVNSEDEAFRLVCVLRKVRAPMEFQ